MLSSQNLIPCSLTFCSFNPYLLFKFKIFNHSSLFAFYTGAQNVTGAYIIMLVYRRLLTTRLHGKAAV